MMAFKAYYKEDVANAIRADVLAVVLTAAANGGHNLEFVRGALCLAQCQALRFGLDWGCLLAELHTAAANGGWCDLLDTATARMVTT